jgi:hypothetical protein
MTNEFSREIEPVAISTGSPPYRIINELWDDQAERLSQKVFACPSRDGLDWMSWHAGPTGTRAPVQRLAVRMPE